MQKNLNIAIICDSIDTTLGWSFISAQRFAEWLAEVGHKIIRCTSTFIDQEKRKGFWYATIYEFSSLCGLGPQKVRFAYPRISSLMDIFRKEKIDIVYNIHPSYSWRQAYRAANRLCIPIVTHSHVYAQLVLPWLPNIFQKLIKNLIARLYRKCDGIIYPTDFAKKDFEEYHIINRQIVISNGVDMNIFHPTKHDTNAMFTILYVWRLDQEKNVHILLEALHILKIENKLNHIQCTIVGSWSEEKKLYALVDTYGIRDIVHFTGKLNQSDVIQAYQKCSAYVLTSWYEWESMTTLEAMACGCPILIADSIYSAAKFFVNKNWYVFGPRNPRDLADKMILLSTNLEMTKMMGERSRENAADFSFEVSVKKMSDFFVSLCKR